MLARFRDIHILVYAMYKSHMSRIVLYVLPCSVTVSSGRKIEKILGFGTNHCSVYNLNFQLIAEELRSIKINNGTCFMIVPNSWLNNELAACNSSLSFHSTSIFAIFSDSSCFWNERLYFVWVSFGKEHTWSQIAKWALFYFHHCSYWRKSIEPPYTGSRRILLRSLFIWSLSMWGIVLFQYFTTLWGTRKEDLVED